MRHKKRRGGSLRIKGTGLHREDKGNSVGQDLWGDVAEGAAMVQRVEPCAVPVSRQPKVTYLQTPTDDF